MDTSKDEIWKEILETMFPEFCEFFFPELHKLIDYSKGIDFLEQELNKIFYKSEVKKRRTDKLAKVILKDGTEKIILVHIEVQGYKDNNFEERMFTYFYRIYDRYKKNIKDIIAIVIFTENNLDYKPSKFELNSYGTKLSYEYNIYKIIEQNEDSLLKNKNIFSYVILSTLYSIKSSNDEKKKYIFKLKLAQLLISNNYSEDDIEKVLKFIDILIEQKDIDLEKSFLREVKSMATTQKKKRIISGIEKLLFEEAMEKAMPIAMEKAKTEVKEELKKESKEQIKEQVKIMKHEGLKIDLIIKLTGLTKEEIDNI